MRVSVSKRGTTASPGDSGVFVKGRIHMTRKKFVNAVLEALCTYGGLCNESELPGANKFAGLRAGLFFGTDENGKNETDHYILLELADGSFWRVLPERALTLEDHEKRMWAEFKRLAAEADAESEEEDDEEVSFEPEGDEEE